MPNLSKSKYLNSLQCDLLLWSHFHARAGFPPTPPDRQFIFDQGHEVGDVAKRLWPGGIEVPFGRSSTCAARTQELLPRRVPIFEASFLVDGRYCRVDILEPATDGESWNLVEVKSTTRVKEINLHDIAFQADALERAGLRLGRLELMHLDRSYTRQGKLEPDRLFRREDVTARARALQPGVAPGVERAHGVIAGGRPHVPIGPHCSDPHECDLKPLCWAGLPEHHLDTLVRGGRRAWELAPGPRADILQLPAGSLNPKQRLQQAVVASGKAHIDRAALRRWLDELEWPVAHLDFEAMGPGIPLFDGTRPYEAVPFQFSLHVQAAPGAEPVHAEHLEVEPQDPRPALAEALGVALAGHAPRGTILAYNSSYEAMILEGLAGAFPAYAELSNSTRDRLVDLAQPFRNFDLYHPRQRGSYSIKEVLPAWVPGRAQAYTELPISDGRQAAREYLESVHGPTLGLDREPTAEKLRAYCAQDTRSMVELLDRLHEVAAGA